MVGVSAVRTDDIRNPDRSPPGENPGEMRRIHRKRFGEFPTIQSMSADRAVSVTHMFHHMRDVAKSGTRLLRQWSQLPKQSYQLSREPSRLTRNAIPMCVGCGCTIITPDSLPTLRARTCNHSTQSELHSEYGSMGLRARVDMFLRCFRC